MEINKDTKIIPIIDQYPSVYETLHKRNNKIKRMKNPILRKTIGSKATLQMVSEMLEISLEEMITIIKKIIETEKPISNKERKEKLKKLLLDIHKGVELQSLKERFREIASGISASEIGQLEQQLITEGVVTPAEITKLSDLHVELFKESLSENEEYSVLPGHPIYTYEQENQETLNLIRKIRSSKEKEKLKLFKDLSDIIIHYTRKENQLFPILEKHDISGPPQVMWSVHDEIRASLKVEDLEGIEKSLKKIEDMIFKEEKILFPMTMEIFTESDWKEVFDGEREIGFAFGVSPGNQWKPLSPADIHKEENAQTSMRNINLEHGKLSEKQINLMLKMLPIDVTFVDQNDEVAYYSDTEDRIFPRSKGIIGRKVQNCHPPESVHIVEDILNKFKSGEKKSAKFWIQLGGKFIVIKYFAVNDEDGNYFGTLEVSQEINDLRELEGECRLAQWDI